jgi:hypothetical protein
MRRYHFHSEDGVRLTDEEGTELEDADAAMDVAVQVMVEALNHNSQEFWRTRSFRVVVTADGDEWLFTLDLGAIDAPALSGSWPGLQPAGPMADEQAVGRRR